jgi:WD40 repeat protein
VTAVAFNSAGTRLASVGWGPQAKVWDLTRQHESASVGGNPRPGVRRVEDCAFTPDGRALWAIRVPAGQLERWDPVTGHRPEPRILDLATAAAGLVIPGRTAAFSAGGRRLAAVAGTDPRIVKVWAPADGGEPVVLAGLNAAVGYVGISADGSRVAAAAAGDSVGRRPVGVDLLVWDAATGQEVGRFPLPGEGCSALALTADGRRLAAATSGPGVEPRVRVWDLDAGREVLSVPSGEEVLSVTFDGPGARLAASTLGPRLLIWDAGTGGVLHAVPCLEPYFFLAFAPDGRRLAGVTRELLTLWDPAEGDEVLTLRGQPRSGLDPPFNPRAAFDPTGRQLAAIQADNTVTIWTAAGYPGVGE